MESVYVKFNSVEKVKAFVNQITGIDSDFDLVSGSIVVDAKSIMGILGMDLNKVLRLNIHRPNPVVLRELQPYLAS